MKPFHKITFGMLTIATLALTACGQDVPSADNPVPASADAIAASKKEGGAAKTADPETKVSTEETVDTSVPENPTVEDVPTDIPTLSPEESKKYMEAQKANPLGINIDEALEKYSSPAVAESFPAEDFDVKEGIRTGLEFYQGLVRLGNFYEPRDVTKDWELIAPVEDKLHAPTADELKKDISDTGRFYWMPTVADSGSFGEHNGVNLDPAGMPVSTWNTPEIDIDYNDDIGNFITITGKRNILFTAETGESITLETIYRVSVSPSGDGEWLVNQMGWKLESVKVNGE